MQDWLKNENTACGEDDTIPQLLLKVKVLDVPKVFEIEQATEEHDRVDMGKCQGGGSKEEQNVQNEEC